MLESLFLIKLQACGIACNFIKKETPTQVFSCEFSEMFKKTFFTEYLRWLLLLIVNLTHDIYTIVL